MSRTEILYLLPYFTSLAISTGVLIYTWKRRQAKGASAYLWYVAGQAFWVLGFILELLSQNKQDKIFWNGIQWLAGFFITIAFPVFAVQYTEYKLKIPRKLFCLSVIFPALLTIVLMTDSFHHLIYRNPEILPTTPFSELTYDFTRVVYGYALYSYIIFFWRIGLLIRPITRIPSLYRTQLAIIIFGFLIPTIGTILTLSGLQIAPQRDATPFTNAVANLIIAWGLFRYRIFEVVPIGRDRLFEAMVDPVVILDNQNLVVDINSALLALLDKNASDIIGQPAKKVIEKFPIPIKLYTHVSYARTETTFDLGGKDVYTK